MRVVLPQDGEIGKPHPFCGPARDQRSYGILMALIARWVPVAQSEFAKDLDRGVRWYERERRALRRAVCIAVLPLLPLLLSGSGRRSKIRDPGSGIRDPVGIRYRIGYGFRSPDFIRLTQRDRVIHSRGHNLWTTWSDRDLHTVSRRHRRSNGRGGDQTSR